MKRAKSLTAALSRDDLHEARRLWEAYQRQGTDGDGLRKLMAYFPRLLAECEEAREGLFGWER